MINEAREFLEERDYKFSSDWHGHFAYLENDELSISWNGYESEVIIDCLTHWLETELGRKFREVYAMWFQVENAFDEQEAIAIETAFRYLKKLEDNGDGNQ